MTYCPISFSLSVSSVRISVPESFSLADKLKLIGHFNPASKSATLNRYQVGLIPKKISNPCVIDTDINRCDAGRRSLNLGKEVAIDASD